MWFERWPNGLSGKMTGTVVVGGIQMLETMEGHLSLKPLSPPLLPLDNFCLFFFNLVAVGPIVHPQSKSPAWE